MSWGKRGFIVALAVGLTAVWGVAWAGAKAHHYVVTYSGAGTYSAKTEASVACGLDKRNETTEFSWLANYSLSLSFGRHGFKAAHDSVQHSTNGSTNNNRSSVSFSGCDGTAACQGGSEPAQGSLAILDVPAAAPGGRSKFRVGGVGYEGWKPVDFGGTWNAGDPGSCAKWAQSGTLITQEFQVANEIQAKFPVKYATLKSLPVGHYFKVHISPGHYAQPKVSVCQPNDGCESETFSWSGTVRVKRFS